MLKSKLIDTKYVDPKGVTRTPNMITSITEDEIKEGKFSPEDILPATAVQVALSNAGGESLWSLNDQGQITNSQKPIELSGQVSCPTIIEFAKVRDGLFWNEDPEYPGAAEACLTSFELMMYDKGQNTVWISNDGTARFTGTRGGLVKIDPYSTGAIPDDAVTPASIYFVYNQAVKGSTVSIDNVSSSASLSDLISSYNNLLTHLRSMRLLSNN